MNNVAAKPVSVAAPALLDIVAYNPDNEDLGTLLPGTWYVSSSKTTPVKDADGNPVLDPETNTEKILHFVYTLREAGNRDNPNRVQLFFRNEEDGVAHRSIPKRTEFTGLTVARTHHREGDAFVANAPRNGEAGTASAAFTYHPVWLMDYATMVVKSAGPGSKANKRLQEELATAALAEAV